MKSTYAWSGVVVCAVVLLLFFFHTHKTTSLQSPTTASTTVVGSTTTTDLGNGITVVTKGGSAAGITIQTIKPTSFAAPSLTRATTFSADLPADQVAQLRSDEQTSIAVLIKDPGQSNYWLQLAIDYKIAGDYQGAAAIWNYLAKVMPTSYVAFEDLGDLYQNFLKNYPKAETNYLQAVKLKPDSIDLYNDLFTLYHYQYKTNTTAAADIVAQGLRANPNNPNLLALQAQLEAGK